MYKTELPVETTLEDELLKIIRKSKSFKMLCEEIGSKERLGAGSLNIKYTAESPESRIIHLKNGEITRDVEGNTANRRHTSDNRKLNLTKSKKTNGITEYHKED